MNGTPVYAKFDFGYFVHVFEDGTVKLSVKPEAFNKGPEQKEKQI
jgi:hypothetical protein